MRSFHRTTGGPDDHSGGDSGDGDSGGKARHDPFRADLRDAVALAAAIGVVGASFGALAAAAGVALPLIIGMSLLVFAGGSQFLVVAVVAAGGSPVAAVAAVAGTSRLSRRGSISAKSVAPTSRLRSVSSSAVIRSSSAIARCATI